MIGMSAEETHNSMPVTTMGIMNALRTLETLSSVSSTCSQLSDHLIEKNTRMGSQEGLLFRNQQVHPKVGKPYHYILNSTRWYGDEINIDTDVDTNNSALLKAIRLYLYNVVKLQNSRMRTLISWWTKTSLPGLVRKTTVGRYDMLAGTMSTYNVVPSPPKEKFQTIGKYEESMATVELKIAK